MLALVKTAAGPGLSLETVPDPVIGKLKTLSVSATVNGTSLPPETYS